MPTLGQRPIYDFRLTPWTATESILRRLTEKKAEIVVRGASGIAKLFGHIDAVTVTVLRPNPVSPGADIDKSAISFIDTELAALLVEGSFDQEYADSLALQFRFVAAATKNISSIISYTSEEMVAIVGGEDRYYDDSIFLSTLRTALDAPAATEYGRLFLKTLPTVTGGESPAQGYFWDEAFILAMLYQTVWSYFPRANQRDQQAILQNYFYSGIVLGVPVRYWLKASLAETVGGSAQMNFFIQALNATHEFVPTREALVEGKNLFEVVRSYLAILAGEKVSTIAQEKFLNAWYQGEEHAGAYRGWLREALNIVLHLKNGDIERY